MGNALAAAATTAIRRGAAQRPPNGRWAGKGTNALETVAIVLIVLWLLGIITGTTLGNFIYVLLVVAVVLFAVRLFRRGA